MRQVLLYRDPESTGWIAEAPSLPGCVSQGVSRDEALQNIRDAIECWIDGAEQVGLPVPGDSLDAELCVV